MFLLGSSAATTIYLDTTYISKEIVGELNNINVDQALFKCNLKYGQERDICYIVVAVAFDAPVEICDNVEFSFYKATCIKAINS